MITTPLTEYLDLREERRVLSGKVHKFYSSSDVVMVIRSRIKGLESINMPSEFVKRSTNTVCLYVTHRQHTRHFVLSGRIHPNGSALNVSLYRVQLRTGFTGGQ
jgi:hypothetical protein